MGNLIRRSASRYPPHLCQFAFLESHALVMPSIPGEEPSAKVRLEGGHLRVEVVQLVGREGLERWYRQYGAHRE